MLCLCLCRYQEEVKPWSQGWFIAARAYPGFCSMKRLEVFLLPLDGMLVHHRSLPYNFVRFPQQFAGTHLYTLCVLSKNTTQCPQPRLEPGPLALESSALTMRPPHLPKSRARLKCPRETSWILNQAKPDIR